MNSKYTSQKIGLMAVFIATGLVLQYVENQILVTPVPGGKLGLSNIVTIINIFVFGGRNSILIAALRSFLGSVMMGGVISAIYSVSGAVLSTVFMWLIKNYFYPRVSIVGISVAGAAVHNITQLLVAAVTYKSIYVFSYLPLLMIIALVSGTLTGYCASLFAKRILKEKVFNEKNNSCFKFTKKT